VRQWDIGHKDCLSVPASDEEVAQCNRGGKGDVVSLDQLAGGLNEPGGTA
jgi:hypothetical protein